MYLFVEDVYILKPMLKCTQYIDSIPLHCKQSCVVDSESTDKDLTYNYCSCTPLRQNCSPM